MAKDADAFLVGEPVHSILMLAVADAVDGRAGVEEVVDEQEDDGRLSIRCKDPSEIAQCGYGDVDVWVLWRNRKCDRG